MYTNITRNVGTNCHDYTQFGVLPATLARLEAGNAKGGSWVCVGRKARPLPGQLANDPFNT